jgi:hypothetical protein
MADLRDDGDHALELNTYFDKETKASGYLRKTYRMCWDLTSP